VKNGELSGEGGCKRGSCFHGTPCTSWLEEEGVSLSLCFVLLYFALYKFDRSSFLEFLETILLQLMFICGNITWVGFIL
jgi:hypothetical protein